MRKINHQAILDILALIPWGTPIFEIEKLYTFHSLIRNKGNRTHAAKDLGLSVRTIRLRISDLIFDGHEHKVLRNQREVDE